MFCQVLSADNTTVLQALLQTEIDWVNAYHQEVWQKVSPRVKDPELLQWIKTHTQPL